MKLDNPLTLRTVNQPEAGRRESGGVVPDMIKGFGMMCATRCPGDPGPTPLQLKHVRILHPTHPRESDLRVFRPASCQSLDQVSDGKPEEYDSEREQKSIHRWRVASVLPR